MFKIIQAFILLLITLIISNKSYTQSIQNQDIHLFFKSYFSEFSSHELTYFMKGQVYDRGFSTFTHEKFYTYQNIQSLIFQHTRSHEGEPGHFRTKFLGADKVLKKLLQIMKKNGTSTLNVGLLKSKTAQYLKDMKLKGDYGFSYPICYQEASGSDTPDYCRPVSISHSAQIEIEELFHFKYKSSLTEEKKELLELNALRLATKILEKNTFLNDDTGGWSGNFIRTMRSGTALTRCGNETWTYVFFVESLIKQGLIKSLYLRQSYRDINRSGYFFQKQKHQEVFIKSKYTKNEYVLDSWFEGGGEMAHISLKEDWKSLELFEDFNDIVPGFRGWTP